MPTLVEKMSRGIDFDVNYEEKVSSRFHEVDDVAEVNSVLIFAMQYPDVGYSQCLASGFTKLNGELLLHSVRRFATLDNKMTILVDLINPNRESPGALVALPTIGAMQMIHYSAQARHHSDDLLFSFGDGNYCQATKYHWHLRDGRKVAMQPLDIYCGKHNNRGLSLLGLKDLETGLILPETRPALGKDGFQKEVYKTKNMVFDEFLPTMVDWRATPATKEVAIKKLSDYLQRCIV